MTRRLSARRAVMMLAFTGLLPVILVGCPKKPPPPAAEVPDTAPAPEVDSGPTVITPLDEEDAGDDADAGPPKKHYGGQPSNGNAAAIKQCCAAMRAQAKSLGTSPEANQLVSAAQICDTFAIAATSGNAPEFAMVRNALKGHQLPTACQGIK
jgi:hypothetical protein